MRFSKPVRRGPATLVAITLLLAACSSDTETTTTTGGPTPTVTSSTTTTTATTITTTTTVPEPATFLTAGNTCLLGWWDGDWQSSDDLPVLGGEQYQVVRLDEPITTTTGSGARNHCDPLGLVSVEFDPPIPGDFLEVDALAVQTDADIRPRLVETLDPTAPAYMAATSELLQGRVAPVPIVNITQVIRADLEGDGVDEVIISASTIPEDLISSQVGDYSILFLRKLIEGEVQTAILGESIVDDLDTLLQDLVVFELAAVADLNGDGQMEIVVNGTVWEGAFLQAFEYVNDDLGPVEVLSCGCGS